MFGLNKKSAEEIANKLVKEELKIVGLNLEKDAHKEGLLKALQKRPALMTTIIGEEANKYIEFILENNTALFVYLKEEQYTDEFAQKFLLFRLNELDKGATKNAKADSVTAQSSIDNKVLLNYAFVAQDDDEIYYYDAELGIPSSLKFSFKATLKVQSAMVLIKKLDLHITQLGKNKIKNTITDIFDNKFKVFISDYIAKNKLGYYALCSNINAVEEEFKQSVVSSFEVFGVELTEFIIKRFAIPKDIQNRIEDQYFNIRKLKVDNDANNEIAKKSLELYETKLAIEKKYPDGIHSLTEYEKDLALKRYLIKNGYNTEEVVDREVEVKDSVEKVDTQIAKKKDVKPEVKKKPSFIKILYYFLTAAFACGFFAMYIDNAIDNALIILGVGVLVLGIMRVVFRDKLKRKSIKGVFSKLKGDK